MLRPYQQDCLDKIKNTTFKKGLCILPTGSGKSHILAQLKGLTVAPRRELVKQNNSKGATCVTINYAYNKKLAGNLLIIDEAHLVNQWEGMYQEVMKNFTQVIGFTATPYRLQTGHLIPDTFDTVLYEVERETLIKNQYLSPRHYPMIPKNLLLNVKTEDTASLVKMSQSICPYTDGALKHFLTKWDNKKAIIYACDLTHAQKCKESLSNYLCAVISGKTPTLERDRIITQFKNNQLSFLINCELLTTGFDCPSLENIIILRPTTSYSLYEQICGRGDRICEGKTQNKIYDFTMSAFNFDVRAKRPNHFRHCIFCYTLTDYRLSKCSHCSKGLIRTETTMKDCTHCGREVFIRASYCPDCGQFLRKNIRLIEGNTKDIHIIKRSRDNFTIRFNYQDAECQQNNFKHLTLHNRNVQAAAVMLAHKEKGANDYQLYYKLNSQGSKTIIKFNLTNSMINV